MDARELAGAAVLLLGTLFFGGCGDSGCSGSSGVPFENVRVMEGANLLETASSDENVTMDLLLVSSVRQVAPDDVLVFGVSDQLPHGLLRKAVTTNDNGNGTFTVSTVQAGLGDVFRELDLCREGRLDPAELKSSDGPLTAYAGEHTLFDFSYPIDERFGDDLLHLEGGTDFSVGYRIDIRTKTTCTLTDGCHIKIKDGTKFLLDAKADTSVTLWAGDAKSWKHSRVMYSKDFSPITIDVAGVPVVMVPELEIIGGVKGSVDAELSTGISASASGSVGIKYYDDEWHPYKSLNHDFDYTAPDLSASADIKAYAGPKVKLKIYDVTGPYADLYGFTKLEADIDADPWWVLYAGLESHGGFRVRVLHHTLVNVDKLIYYHQIDVADAGGGL